MMNQSWQFVCKRLFDTYDCIVFGALGIESVVPFSGGWERVIPSVLGERRPRRLPICVSCINRTGSEWGTRLVTGLQQLPILAGMPCDSGSVQPGHFGTRILQADGESRTRGQISWSNTPSCAPGST